MFCVIFISFHFILLRFAVESGVHLSTFDSEDELFKVANFDPQAELLVRIRSDDELAYQVLGQKFGASLSEAFRLLDLASKKKLNVIGVRLVDMKRTLFYLTVFPISSLE